MADVIVTANQTLFNQDVKNVMCFGNLVDDPTILQTFTDNFRVSWANGLATIQANDWTLNSLSFSFIDATQVLYSIEYNFTAGILTGSSNADNLISQSSLLVSLQRQNTKPNRGRIYFAGLPDSQLAGGRWIATALDEAESMVEIWRTGVSIGSSTANLRILRRPSAVFPSFVSNGVDSVIARPEPAVQRSRRINPA